MMLEIPRKSSKKISMNMIISREEKKRYEVERSQLLAIIDSVDDAIYSTDLDGRILTWNKGAEKIFGYLKHEIMGKKIFDKMVPKNKLEEARRIRDLVRQGKRVLPYETIRLRKDKKKIYAWFSVSLIRSKNGKAIGVSVIARDISKRRKLEEERNKFSSELNQLINMAPVGIGFIDHQCNFLRVNKMLSMMDGKRVEAHVGKPVSEIFPKSLSRQLTKYIETLLSTKQSYSLEVDTVLNTKTREVRFWSIMLYYIAFSKEQPGVGFLVQDITDAKMLEKRKDDFISMASHELKTPLTSIKAFTQILQNSPAIEEEKRGEYYDRIETQVGKLTKIINDLLDISKIRIGSFSMIKEKFAFDLLVEEIISNYRYMQHVPHKIFISGRTNKELYADRDMIQQLVTNLINNAIRYSPGKKKINIFLTSNGKDITFSVKDYGVGISPADQKRIFQNFYRVIRPQNHEYPGLGIGLFISKEIVLLHNGKIDVTSEVGKGSIFSVSLPLQNHML